MSVHIVPHPLVQDALLRLRDIKTETEEFRRLSVRISVLLVAEALRDSLQPLAKGRIAEAKAAYAKGLEVARTTGDLQTGKEIEVFLRRLEKT